MDFQSIFGFVQPKYNYWIYIILMMIGLYGMIAKNNMIKKVIGMTIFQTSIILFYVSIGVKRGASLPIVLHGPHSGGLQAVNPEDYANPLPHVLMLTAIVVGVATLGVALALIQRIYQRYGTIEESEILEQLR